MQTVEQRRRSNKLIAHIDVMALLSVFFVMFVILLSMTNSSVHRIDHSGDIPYANHPVSEPGANREDAIIIAVARMERSI